MWDSETDQIFKVDNAIVLKVKESYLKKVGCVNSDSGCFVCAIACNWMGSRSFFIERERLIPIPVSDLPLHLNFPYIEQIFFDLIKEGGTTYVPKTSTESREPLLHQNEKCGR
jgi:hypothetical protein